MSAIAAIDERRDVAQLIFDIARRRRWVTSSGEPNLRLMASKAKISYETLIGLMTKQRWPEFETLIKLERGTGVSMETWLVAFGLMPPRRARDANLSPGRRRWNALVENEVDDDINRTIDLLLGLANSPLGRDHSSEQTDAVKVVLMGRRIGDRGQHP